MGYGAVYGIMYSFIALFMTFALFNVIVAIFVENTLAAAKGNDVLKKRQRNQDEAHWAERTQELVHTIIRIQKRLLCGDVNNAEEIENLTKEAGTLTITKSFFKDLFETFDADDSGTLTVVELLKGIKKLRGDPRRSDVIGVSLVVHAIHDLVCEQNESIKNLGRRVH